MSITNPHIAEIMARIEDSKERDLEEVLSGWRTAKNNLLMSVASVRDDVKDVADKLHEYDIDPPKSNYNNAYDCIAERLVKNYPLQYREALVALAREKDAFVVSERDDFVTMAVGILHHLRNIDDAKIFTVSGIEGRYTLNDLCTDKPTIDNMSISEINNLVALFDRATNALESISKGFERQFDDYIADSLEKTPLDDISKELKKAKQKDRDDR
jgi:hypothetical protein